MGYIYLEDMEFFSYHGHFAEEKVVGNKFIVNLALKTDVHKAGVSDNLNDTIDYQAVYKLVRKEMQQPSDLLEHVAKRIYDMIVGSFNGIEKCKVKISKMNPPMGGKMKCVSVEIDE